jgi:hypothetical protein
VLWFTLTTREAADNSKLAYDHKRLRMELYRKLNFQGVQFVAVRSRGDKNPSLQHLHGLWAWKGPRSFYVPQQWLSDEWRRIHGAWIVDIKRVHSAGLVRYMVTQYCSSQNALQRLSWSWWNIPFALAAGWETMKRLASVSCRGADFKWERHYFIPMAQVVAAWEHLLSDGSALMGDVLIEFRGRHVVEVF